MNGIRSKSTKGHPHVRMDSQMTNFDLIPYLLPTPHYHLQTLGMDTNKTKGIGLSFGIVVA